MKAGKGKKQKVPCTTIIDADYADGIALLANSPAQACYIVWNKQQVA